MFDTQSRAFLTPSTSVQQHCFQDYICNKTNNNNGQKIKTVKFSFSELHMLMFKKQRHYFAYKVSVKAMVFRVVMYTCES